MKITLHLSRSEVAEILAYEFLGKRVIHVEMGSNGLPLALSHREIQGIIANHYDHVSWSCRDQYGRPEGVTDERIRIIKAWVHQILKKARVRS